MDISYCSLSSLIKHYGSVIDIPDGVQNKTNDRNYTNATSYKLAILIFEIVTVAVITQYLLGIYDGCPLPCKLRTAFYLRMLKIDKKFRIF